MNASDYKNFKERYGSQLPPLLTDKRFIDFIRKYLTMDGYLPEAESRVLPGADIRVENFMDAQGKAYVVHYEKSTDATHLVTVQPGALEYGTPIAAGAITIGCKITRGSRLLSEVVWGDISPAVSLDAATLEPLALVEFSGTNASAWDGLSTRVAADGRYSDVAGRQVALKASITRQRRWFWGVTTAKDAGEAAEKIHDPTFFSSSLGAKPRTLHFDPGYQGKLYRCFVLPESEAQTLEAQDRLQLLDANSPCHEGTGQILSIAPNPVNGDYTADYRFLFASMAVDVKSVLTTE